MDLATSIFWKIGIAAVYDIPNVDPDLQRNFLVASEATRRGSARAAQGRGRTSARCKQAGGARVAAADGSQVGQRPQPSCREKRANNSVYSAIG